LRRSILGFGWAGTLGCVRLVLAVAGAAILASPAAGGGFPRFGAGCARDDFASGGATIRAELCRARGGSGAAVVVLHGCGGFSTFDHRIVTALPGYGISTLDVDYFGPTQPAGKKGFCNRAPRDARRPAAGPAGRERWGSSAPRRSCAGTSTRDAARTPADTPRSGLSDGPALPMSALGAGATPLEGAITR